MTSGEPEVGDDLLEAAVLVLEFVEAARFVNVEAAAPGLPAEVRVLTDTGRAADVAGALPGFNLLEDLDDLLVGELRLSHDGVLPAVDCRRTLTSAVLRLRVRSGPFLQIKPIWVMTSDRLWS